MDLLKFMIKTLFFACLTFLSGCQTAICTDVGRQIQIDDWISPIPEKNTVYHYKEGSNFSLVESKSCEEIKNEQCSSKKLVKVAPLPRKIVLYRYKKGSNFSILERIYDSGFKAEMWQREPNLLLTLQGEKFPINADYKLVLDDKIEYRISELIPGIEAQGCGLYSKINQCSNIYSSYNMMFDSNCAEIHK